MHVRSGQRVAAVRPDVLRRAVLSSGAYRGGPDGSDCPAPAVAAWPGGGGFPAPVRRLSPRCHRLVHAAALGVPCPYPAYDIVFMPDLPALALSVPGLMVVNEKLLGRPDGAGDQRGAMICAHEVAHAMVRLPCRAAVVGRRVAGRGDRHLPVVRRAGRGRWGQRIAVVDRIRLHRQAGGISGGRAAEPGAGVVSGQHGHAGPGQAVRHPVHKGRQRHPLPRRAHRRRRAAAGAERLPDQVRLRQRDAGRPGRMLVPGQRAGPGRLGGAVAAHRGHDHDPAGRKRHRGPGRTAPAADRHRALRPGRGRPAAPSQPGARGARGGADRGGPG